MFIKHHAPDNNEGVFIVIATAVTRAVRLKRWLTL
jgi:hypothetical protein